MLAYAALRFAVVGALLGLGLGPGALRTGLRSLPADAPRHPLSKRWRFARELSLPTFPKPPARLPLPLRTPHPAAAAAWLLRLRRLL